MDSAVGIELSRGGVRQMVSASMPSRLRQPARIWMLGALLLVAAVLAGCGSLPPHEGVERSKALAPRPDTALAKIAAASTPPEPDLSGFRLLPHGAFALDARLQLIQRAQQSLDVQYYVFENDATGRVLMRALRDAAERGVRVRVLVDDLYTTKTQPLWSDLMGHSNVQVRLFNPFCCARGSGLAGRVVASFFDVWRINHRMHNKLLVADGVMAVVGGRNIADEYFLRNDSQNFIDLDSLVLGPVIKRLADYFDEYWNSDVVYPLERLVPPQASPVERRARFDAAVRNDPPPARPPETDVLGYGPVREDLDDGRIGLHWARARAYADPPDKRSKTQEQAAEHSLTYETLMTIWTAKEELTITSPYLIPGRKGIEAFQGLGRNRTKVTVLTNSLAATDEPIVHTGYSRYREPLIDAGVDLYELSPQRSTRERRLGFDFIRGGSSIGRLHAKTAIVDRKLVFIGSMNLDPRSETQNTEIGVFVESPPLARELQRVVNISRLQSAYRVKRGPNGGLQWHGMDGDKEIVLGVEPETTLWTRVYNMLIAPFVPEQLL
jgi:putative cardiolipin synthase